jgi:hypothetical protein
MKLEFTWKMASPSEKGGLQSNPALFVTSFISDQTGGRRQRRR